MMNTVEGIMRGWQNNWRKRCHKRRKYRVQNIRYFAPVFGVILVYLFNLFRKLILPTRGGIVLVIRSFVQENLECFLEKCSILGRKLALGIL